MQGAESKWGIGNHVNEELRKFKGLVAANDRGEVWQTRDQVILAFREEGT